MGSLYRKAQDFLEESDARRAELRLVRKDELAADEDREISAEDRTKILGQIEEVVGKIRIAITPQTFRFKPQRRGWVFPVVVNIAAIVLVVGGILLAVELGRRSEQSIIAAPATLATAEGKLLEAFKEESRQELEGKDREIADIRGRLAGIDQEKERIRLDAESRVRTREQELRDEFTRSLEAERARLAASGLGEDAIAERLAALEAAANLELEQRLEAARAQVQAEREEQERTVERLRAEYEQGLAAAQGERARLAEEAAQRQAELEAGSRERQLALEQEKGQALDELARLRRAQENQQLVLDQFLSYYGKARDAIQTGEITQARTVLAEFRKYMDEPAVASLPGVAARRQVELFLIASLEETMTRLEGEAQSQQNTQSLVASANLVTAVAELVEQGDALFAQKDYAKARDLYVMALSRIPALQAGLGRMEEIERVFQDQAKTELAGMIAEANAAYRAGDYERAVAAYSGALVRLQGERGTVDTLVAQLEEIGARAREAELQPRIAELERQVAAERTTVGGLRGDLTARGTELDSLRAELEAIRAERDQAVESARSLGAVDAAELERTRADLLARETELDQVRAELDAARAELASVRDEADQARLALTGQTTEVSDVEARLGEAQTQLEARVAELTEVRAALESRTAELSARTRELEETATALAQRDQDLEAARGQAAAADQGQELRARVDRITGRSDAVTALRAAAAAVTLAPAESSRGELLELLQTKLRVQRVLMSDQVLREYPDLYEGNERYLQALVTERATQARVQTLRDLDGALGRLVGGTGAQTSETTTFTTADEQALLLGMLDKLKALLD